MDKLTTWRAGRMQIVMSVTLTILYFCYIAACMFATEMMASPAPFGTPLSWSLWLGILLLAITVVLSIVYLFLSNKTPEKTELEQ